MIFPGMVISLSRDMEKCDRERTLVFASCPVLAQSCYQLGGDGTFLPHFLLCPLKKWSIICARFMARQEIFSCWRKDARETMIIEQTNIRRRRDRNNESH